VDPKAGLDDMEKRKFLTLPGLELRPLDRPARSQSLYRLCRYSKLSLIRINLREMIRNNEAKGSLKRQENLEKK
jgi:hypothetical protein